MNLQPKNYRDAEAEAVKNIRFRFRFRQNKNFASASASASASGKMNKRTLYGSQVDRVHTPELDSPPKTRSILQVSS